MWTGLDRKHATLAETEGGVYLFYIGLDKYGHDVLYIKTVGNNNPNVELWDGISQEYLDGTTPRYISYGEGAHVTNNTDVIGMWYLHSDTALQDAGYDSNDFMSFDEVNEMLKELIRGPYNTDERVMFFKERYPGSKLGIWKDTRLEGAILMKGIEP